MISFLQTATAAWHLPSIYVVASWLLGSLITGGFIFANLKVNRDDRIEAYEKEQLSTVAAREAGARIAELELQQQPRVLTIDQQDAFIAATKNGPFGPVILVTRTAIPDKEQEDFVMQLRTMLDEAGFGVDGSNIINGFSTNVDPGSHLLIVLGGSSPPLYFSNLASALYEQRLLSADNPVAINNPKAKEGALYLFVPEK